MTDLPAALARIQAALAEIQAALAEIQRARSVDNSGDDPWTDQPAGEFDIGQPEDRPGSVDARLTRALGIEFGKAGITDRGVRLGMVADMIGRSIITSDQLSRAEAEHVLKALRAKREATT